MYEAKFSSDFYLEINNDKELYTFFTQFLQTYKFHIKIWNDLKEQTIRKKMPSFKKLYTYIDNLKESGIVVENYDSWFNIDSYIWDYQKFQSRRIFLKATFNYHTLTIEDIENIKTSTHYENNKNKTMFQYIAFESKYNSALITEKRIKKKLKKANQNPKKYDEYQELLKEAHKAHKEVVKTEFLLNLSLNQKQLLIETEEKINKLLFQFIDFFEEKRETIEKFETMKFETYCKVYKKLMKNNKDNIDIEGIKNKIYKILVFNQLNYNKNNNDDYGQFDYEYLEIIDFFMKDNELYFNNLYKLTFDIFDLTLEKQKLLKKEV